MVQMSKALAEILPEMEWVDAMVPLVTCARVMQDHILMPRPIQLETY